MKRTIIMQAKRRDKIAKIFKYIHPHYEAHAFISIDGNDETITVSIESQNKDTVNQFYNSMLGILNTLIYLDID